MPQEPDGPGRMVIIVLTTLLTMTSVPLHSFLKTRIGRLRYLKRKRYLPRAGLHTIPNRPTA